ncbi:hypothetical protein ACFSTC_41995 [Nonomuraea ferruginea]
MLVPDELEAAEQRLRHHAELGGHPVGADAEAVADERAAPGAQHVLERLLALVVLAVGHEDGVPDRVRVRRQQVAKPG